MNKPTNKSIAVASVSASKKEEIMPFKIVGELHACRKNTKGEIVGETVVGPIVVYAPDFSRVEEIVNKDWPEVVRQLKAQAALPRDQAE